MIVISQNQDKAIDSKDILFLFIQQTLKHIEPYEEQTDTGVYRLLAMVRGQQASLPWGAIELFRDEDQETTNKMLCFLAKIIFNESLTELQVSEVQKQI